MTNFASFKAFAIRHRQIILILFVTAFVLPEVTVYFNRPSRGADIFGYFAAGKDAFHKAPLYTYTQPGKNNTWPPFYSVFMIPLYLIQKTLGTPLAKEVWYFFNFIALIWMMKLWTEMLYGIRPKFCASSAMNFSSPRIYVPFLMVLPPMVNNFFMLQINVLLLLINKTDKSQIVSLTP